MQNEQLTTLQKLERYFADRTGLRSIADKSLQVAE